MKINSYFAALSTGMMLACLGLNGCKEPEEEPTPVPDEPTIEATFTSSDSKSATFTVKTSKISEIAFAAYSFHERNHS